MNICFVSDQAFPAIGGEGTSTQNFSRGLVERGHKVIVFTSRVKNPPQEELVKIYRFFSIPIPFGKGYFSYPFASTLYKILKKEKIDVVQINLPTFLGLQTIRVAKKLKIPKILGLHVEVGNVIPHWLLQPFKFIVALFVHLWFFCFFRLGDMVIAPSNFAADYVKKYTHKPTRGEQCRTIKVVSNGIDLEKFNPKKVSDGQIKIFKEKYSLGDLPYLLYLGRVSHEKNLLFLLKIMSLTSAVATFRSRSSRQASGFKLLIIGRGSQEKLLKRKIKSLKLEKRVIFINKILPRDEVLAAYRGATLFILPSFFELQGIVILETMAMGCPILVGRAKESAAPELVKEGVNGYTFSLKDPNDAAQKITKILSDKDLQESMSKASLELVQSHNIQKSLSNLEKIYKSVETKFQHSHKRLN